MPDDQLAELVKAWQILDFVTGRLDASLLEDLPLSRNEFEGLTEILRQARNKIQAASGFKTQTQ